MRLNVNGVEIKFDPDEVKATNRLVYEFLDSVRKVADENLAPTYWFTLLVSMHVISDQMLKDYDIENISMIMERLSWRDKHGKDSN